VDYQTESTSGAERTGMSGFGGHLWFEMDLFKSFFGGTHYWYKNVSDNELEIIDNRLGLSLGWRF
jgi:hypothetical protein